MYRYASTQRGSAGITSRVINSKFSRRFSAAIQTAGNSREKFEADDERVRICMINVREIPRVLFRIRNDDVGGFAVNVAVARDDSRGDIVRIPWGERHSPQRRTQRCVLEKVAENCTPKLREFTQSPAIN